MKVFIGPAPRWFGIYQFMDLFTYVGMSRDRAHELAGKAPEWIADAFQWFHTNMQKRDIEVIIDEYDIFSADTTLAYIILPTLNKLRDAKNGTPLVAPEDAHPLYHPRMYTEDGEHHGWDKGAEYRWDWILREMIFAFETKLDFDDNYLKVCYSKDFDINWKSARMEVTGSCDYEMMKRIEDRVQNGFNLFGKYYQALWT